MEGINYYVSPKFKQTYASNREQLRRVRGCRVSVGWSVGQQFCVVGCLDPGRCAVGVSALPTYHDRMPARHGCFGGSPLT